MSPGNRFLGEFEQMVLAAILRLEDHAYGVSIIEDIARHAARDVSSGALSVTLDRMERKGLVRSRLADPSDGRGGRPRRYVEVTSQGLEEARQSREALLNMWRDLDEAYEG
ncbi:MAG: PadR family transcriptional regulator [Gemmatimonadota bacterium]